MRAPKLKLRTLMVAVAMLAALLGLHIALTRGRADWHEREQRARFPPNH